MLILSVLSFKALNLSLVTVTSSFSSEAVLPVFFIVFDFFSESSKLMYPRMWFRFSNSSGSSSSLESFRRLGSGFPHSTFTSRTTSSLLEISVSPFSRTAIFRFRMSKSAMLNDMSLLVMTSLRQITFWWESSKASLPLIPALLNWSFNSLSCSSQFNILTCSVLGKWSTCFGRTMPFLSSLVSKAYFISSSSM